MRSLQALGLFVLATVVATVSGYRLTAQEDFDRSRDCGSIPQNKIYNATAIDGKNAPWLVQVNYSEDGATKQNSGFFISDRHVLVSSEIFMAHSKANYTDTFVYIKDQTHADLKTCKSRIMPIPQYIFRDLKVMACVGAKAGQRCMTPVPHVIDATYIGNCDPSMISYGIVVLELAKPVKSITPVCIHRKRVEEIGEKLHVFGAGTGETDKSFPAHRLAEVTDTCADEQGNFNVSVCLRWSGSCHGDFGGPVTKKMFNTTTIPQHYAVAMLWSYGCDQEYSRTKHISISSFAKEIGKTTGIGYWSSIDYLPTQSRNTRTIGATTPTSPLKQEAKVINRRVVSKHFVISKIV